MNAENERLCNLYPFLNPHDDSEDYTYLDDMPYGWRQAFGEQMCQEIRESLLAEGGQELLNSYHVVQVKEKFGGLRWYDDGCPESTKDIIHKYEILSTSLCVECGKPATKHTSPWILPVCDACYNKLMA